MTDWLPRFEAGTPRKQDRLMQLLRIELSRLNLNLKFRAILSWGHYKFLNLTCSTCPLILPTVMVTYNVSFPIFGSWITGQLTSENKWAFSLGRLFRVILFIYLNLQQTISFSWGCVSIRKAWDIELLVVQQFLQHSELFQFDTQELSAVPYWMCNIRVNMYLLLIISHN